MMKTERSSILGKPNFTLIVALAALALLAFLVAGWLFVRTGHPDMHTQPQPRNNKGMLQPQKAAPVVEAALHIPVMGITSRW